MHQRHFKNGWKFACNMYAQGHSSKEIYAFIARVECAYNDGIKAAIETINDPDSLMARDMLAQYGFTAEEMFALHNETLSV